MGRKENCMNILLVGEERKLYEYFIRWNKKMAKRTGQLYFINYF